jgi:hypothetical protein
MKLSQHKLTHPSKPITRIDQIDGKAPERSINNMRYPDKKDALLEGLKAANRSLLRQKDELLFAYRTLETGYQRYWEFFNYAPDGYW